jgi:hypothetical protein
MNDNIPSRLDRLIAAGVAWANAKDLPEDAFDEAVIDLASEDAASRYNAAEGPASDEDAFDSLHEDAESLASDINQGGFSEQIAFLIDGFEALPSETVLIAYLETLADISAAN